MDFLQYFPTLAGEWGLVHRMELQIPLTAPTYIVNTTGIKHLQTKAIFF